MLKYFDLLKTIGKGTFGRVLLARHKENNTIYALKMLKTKKLRYMRQLHNLEREKKALVCCLPCPFIVNIKLLFEYNQYECILLEYIPGGELFTLLRDERRLDIYTAKFYMAQICLALDYMHKNNLMYRDLKPENIMINLDGYIKLTDLGFTRDIKKNSEFCGTAEYMAPELLDRQGHSYEVDFWALGIVLYEMLIGLPPFSGKTTNEINVQIKKYNLNFYGIDILAENLIRKLLVVDPKKRMGRKNGMAEIMGHAFFRNIDFDRVLKKEMFPPFMPFVKSDIDTDNFLKYDEEDSVDEEEEKKWDFSFYRFSTDQFK